MNSSESGGLFSMPARPCSTAFARGFALNWRSFLQAFPESHRKPSMNLAALNQEYANQHPQQIITHALSLPGKAVVTTHFGPLEAVILHMASKAKPDLQVIWVDHGYNTK